MNVQRGDIVLLDYPYPSGGGAKVRPALVVQNDRDNRRLVNTIIVQITSVTSPGAGANAVAGRNCNARRTVVWVAAGFGRELRKHSYVGQGQDSSQARSVVRLASTDSQ